jgi:hypothetical protein
LGSTHHHHEVIWFKVRNGFPRIDFRGVPRQSVALHERPENARMLDVQMLQHDNFHSGPSLLMGARVYSKQSACLTSPATIALIDAILFEMSCERNAVATSQAVAPDYTRRGYA